MTSPVFPEPSEVSGQASPPGRVLAAGSSNRPRLLAARLTAHVTDVTGAPPRDPVVLPGGVAALVGDTAWVLLDDGGDLDRRPATSLGAALVWADRHNATTVVVVADSDAGILARRAEAFTTAISVLAADGRNLTPATPDPPPAVTDPDPEFLVAAGALSDAGAEIVVEHGEVTGEVAGLEVGRVVRGADGTVIAAPGVGRNDREAHATLAAAGLITADGVGNGPGAGITGSEAGDPQRAVLARVVGDVARHRSGEAADRHPLGRMARQRWLRSWVLDRPGVAGATALEPAEPPVARMRVDSTDAAFAVGTTPDGMPLVVACSAGVDLDLVPSAADARSIHAARTGRPDTALVLVATERDLHPVTRRLNGQLLDPAVIVAVPDDWYAADLR